MENTEHKWQFPQYRKLRDADHYYRVDAFDRMTELVIREPFYQIIETAASVFPDRVLLNDLLQCHENRWVAIQEQEFSDTLANAKVKWKEIA